MSALRISAGSFAEWGRGAGRSVPATVRPRAAPARRWHGPRRAAASAARLSAGSRVVHGWGLRQDQTPNAAAVAAGSPSSTNQSLTARPHPEPPELPPQVRRTTMSWAGGAGPDHQRRPDSGPASVRPAFARVPASVPACLHQPCQRGLRALCHAQPHRRTTRETARDLVPVHMMEQSIHTTRSRPCPPPT